MNVFVCAAVWVCLSVGVGYWINENSIKWRDCSVMWSQTQEILVWRDNTTAVGKREMLVSLWCPTDQHLSEVSGHIPILKEHTGVTGYAFIKNLGADVCLRQTLRCRLLNVFFLFSFHVWLTLTNTNYQLPWCVIIRSTGNSTFMKTKHLRSALKILTTSSVYGGKKESMQCLHNNLIVADLWGAACVWLGQHVQFNF